MDAACRHVRETSTSATQSAVCMVLQQDGSVGGAATLWQIAASLVSSVQSGGTCACGLTAANFIDSEQFVRGWMRQQDYEFVRVSFFDSGTGTPVPLCKWIEQSLAAQHQEPGKPDLSGSKPRFVVIDSLSLALMYYSTREVLAALHSLQADVRVAGIVTLLCTGIHTQQEIDAMRSAATCEVLLRPINQLTDMVASTSGQCIHVEAVTSTLRHSGRRRARQAKAHLSASFSVDNEVMSMRWRKKMCLIMIFFSCIMLVGHFGCCTSTLSPR